jgi:hypothetical protein
MCSVCILFVKFQFISRAIYLTAPLIFTQLLTLLKYFEEWRRLHPEISISILGSKFRKVIIICLTFIIIIKNLNFNNNIRISDHRIFSRRSSSLPIRNLINFLQFIINITSFGFNMNVNTSEH